jgi:hypothetical protein
MSLLFFAASRACLRGMVSSFCFCIADLGGGNNIVPEIAAQVPGGKEVDRLSSERTGKFLCDLEETEKSGSMEGTPGGSADTRGGRGAGAHRDHSGKIQYWMYHTYCTAGTQKWYPSQQRVANLTSTTSSQARVQSMSTGTARARAEGLTFPRTTAR